MFTEGEQAFYKEKGFDNEPKRCVECRRARKANNNNKWLLFNLKKAIMNIHYSRFICE